MSLLRSGHQQPAVSLVTEGYHEIIPGMDTKISTRFVQEKTPEPVATPHHLFQADPDHFGMVLLRGEEDYRYVIEVPRSPELVEIGPGPDLVEAFRFVVDPPPLLLEQTELVCLLLGEEGKRPDLAGAEDDVLHGHIRDDARELSCSGPAQGSDAEADALLVIHVEKTNTAVRLRTVHSPGGKEGGEVGSDPRICPPVDDFPVGIP